MRELLQNQTYEKPIPAGADIIGYQAGVQAKTHEMANIGASGLDTARDSYQETLADLTAVEEEMSALEAEMSDLTERISANPSDRGAQREFVETQQLYVGLQEDQQYFQQETDRLQSEYDAARTTTSQAGVQLESYLKAA